MAQNNERLLSAVQEQSGRAELLSPAGSAEALMAALRCGCDAVYLGTKRFSARGRAANFTREELSDAVSAAHKRGVKVYQAINTLVFDEELDALAEELSFACAAGIDGVIVQDLAAAALVKACCPTMPLHASTQMTIFSEHGIRAARELGFSRCVLARELSGGEIRALTRLGVETEVFVHGALCMCVSGQCYLSAMIGSRSANRGDCAQACRLPFAAGTDLPDGACALSLKDLSVISRAGELSEMGVSALKIEGRMKRPEYCAAAVAALRECLDGGNPDLSALRAVFSRSGFTDGYYTGALGADMFGIRRREDVVSAEGVLGTLRDLYRHEEKRADISFSATLTADARILCTATDGVCMVTAEGAAQEARSRPADADYVRKNFEKLGDTIYRAGEFFFENAGMLTAPAAEFNALRRTLCDALDLARTARFTPTHHFDEAAVPRSFYQNGLRRAGKAGLRLVVRDPALLRGIALGERDTVAIPLGTEDRADFLAPEQLLLTLPRFTRDEKAMVRALKRATDRGFSRVLCTNLAHFSVARALGLEAHGDFGLNITNSLAVRTLEALGLRSFTASPELKAAQFNRLGGTLARGIAAYGRLPLMLTANCPIKSARGDSCAGCPGVMTDRTGRVFPVVCDQKNGYAELLNADPIVLSDKLAEFPAADFFTLLFTDETPTQIEAIITAYRNGTPLNLPAGSFTRGLYFRGV
ncbi:MAG: U32 family peptidase [Oscillospiraceae bacterium]